MSRQELNIIITGAGSGIVAVAAREFYIDMLRRVPDALKGRFDYYRGMDASIPQYRDQAEKGRSVLACRQNTDAAIW
ncbi:hypothetical protein [Escherichia coli]|uniref:hypothetical protein n=1 Tax=Escherichia coli TaxID=562 RepID=UPI00191A7065|nr:hypothetical protein [Escherichia coli]CAD6102238.1 Uncharacterised protein [Escherichia coli]CAD6167261.1 Uncharacterised protein [Escherichia coli]